MYKQCKNFETGEVLPIVKRLTDNAFIPFDEANTDYQAFLKYKEEGGKVYGADEEVPVNG